MAIGTNSARWLGSLKPISFENTILGTPGVFDNESEGGVDACQLSNLADKAAAVALCSATIIDGELDEGPNWWDDDDEVVRKEKHLAWEQQTLKSFEEVPPDHWVSLIDYHS